MESIDGQAQAAREGHELPGTGLTIAADRKGGLVVLTVRGSIDILTVPQLADAVREAISGVPAGLIIDITEVDFLSSAGMAALVTAHENIAPTGKFGVVADGPATERPMRLVGLDKTILMYATVDAAAADFAEESNDPYTA
ncbi:MULTISPECIES: STAS domain-containing protein [Actinomycetes]|uniref:STAS domain-containing protein n=1 Tax=Actinomycetes TaxID=1760 RepID=UPI0009DF5618|nr:MULTISPECIES: STAS domain-containing protein [Actinomycetes]